MNGRSVEPPFHKDLFEMIEKIKNTIESLMAALDESWLNTSAEAILEPELPIVDPHHHFWDYPTHRYLLEQLLADTGSGHKIEATVFIECAAFYRRNTSLEMRVVGEVEFVNGQAAMAASGRYAGSCRYRWFCGSDPWG